MSFIRSFVWSVGRSDRRTADSFNFVSLSSAKARGDRTRTCKQFVLRLSLFFITWAVTPPRPKSMFQQTAERGRRLGLRGGNKEMRVRCCSCWKCRLGPLLLSPCPAKVTSHRITEFREGISSSSCLLPSSSYLSLRFEKFVLALRDSSKFVIFLLPPSLPGTGTRTDGRPFAPGRRLLVCGDPREFSHQQHSAAPVQRGAPSGCQAQPKT